jgi:hypothetical protein
MYRLPCLLALLGGLASLQAAPAPLPRPKPPPPPAEVVVTLLDADTPAPRIEVTVGPRKLTVQATPRWDEDLAIHLQLLRADRKTPDRLVVVCDVADTPAALYIRLIRACRNAGFSRVLLRANGKRP